MVWFRLSPISHAFLQRLLKPQWCPYLNCLSPSSPSSRHPSLGHAPTSLFIGMGIALTKHLMQVAYMEGGVDPAAMCFVCLQPALCKQVSGFSWMGQDGNTHYQERKEWYSPGNSEWVWSVVNTVLIKPNRSIALSRTAELWLSQDAQGWISLDCTLDFTWHEAHIWSLLQKNGFCRKRLHAWIYLNCHLQEDIH